MRAIASVISATTTRLGAVQFLSWSASYATPVVLAFAVVAAGGSSSAVGLVLAADTFGMAVTIIGGGVVADRLPRTRLVAAAEATAAGGQAAAAVLLLGGVAPLPWLVVTQLVVGCSRGLLFPALTATVPSLVPNERLAAVNGVLASLQSSARLAAPVVAGIVVSTAGTRAAIWFLSGLYLCSASVACTLPALARATTTADSIFGEIIRGWRSFSSRPWLWRTVAWFALAAALTQAPLYVLGPSIARAHYGGAAAWGLVFGAVGAGALAGGALAGAAGRRSIRLGVGAYVATAGLPVALGVAAPLAAVIATAALAGLGAAFFSATWFTVFQQNVPAPLLGRTSAWDWLCSLAVLPLAMVAAAPAADVLGQERLLILSAAIAAALTAAVAATRVLVVGLGGGARDAPSATRPKGFAPARYERAVMAAVRDPRSRAG